jgi:hypothetical protein
MNQLEPKIVMLSRQEMASLSQALDMTADMIEGSFDEVTEPASPHALRAVALRGGSLSCPGSDPTIPATVWLTLHDDEIPHVTHALASFMDAHSEELPTGIQITDREAVLAQI